MGEVLNVPDKRSSTVFCSLSECGISKSDSFHCLCLRDWLNYMEMVVCITETFLEERYKGKESLKQKEPSESDKSRRTMYCDTCKEEVDAWDSHLSSERHITAHEGLREGTGIFVRGFDPNIKHKQMKLFFSVFGHVDQVQLNKKQMFAIVEFRHRNAADLVLSREIFFHGKKLKIMPRKGRARIFKPSNPGSNGNTSLTSFDSDCEVNKEAVNEKHPMNREQSFESQMNGLVRKIQNAGVDSQVKVLCHSLERVLSPHFPECQIYPFGSSVTGLSLEESDVDIFVDLSKLYSQEHIDSISGDLVLKTKTILNRDNEFARCVAIPKARVPIVKCLHRATRLNCDINFQNALGIHNSNLIKLYLAMIPRLKTILIIVKYWGKINQIIGPGNLTSYAIVMLMLFYLQQLPNEVLPTVEVLQSMCLNVVKVHGWECHFKWDMRNRSSKLESTLKVLKGFFSFYSTFNFSDYVVILKNASAVHKQVFINPPKDSPCYKYKMAIEEAKVEPIQLDKVMTVMDPFVLNHNITASVRLRTLNKFQIKCFKWAEIMLKMENEEEEMRLQPLFNLDPRLKKIKFPYLEYWKEQGNVKFFVPLSSFNPKNTYETGELSYYSDFGKIELLISHLKYIFEKVLCFSMFREEKDPDESVSDKQIQKTDGMDDVHGDRAQKKEFKSLTTFYEGYYHIWIARQGAYKQFSFPNTMPLMEKEMHVTNYLVDTYYKGSTKGLQKTVIKCIYVPIMNNRCLDVQILLCDGGKSFKPMITLLLNLLQKWLEK